MKKYKSLENKVFTVKEAADYLKMGYEAFRYHIKLKRAPAFLHEEKPMIFSQESLDSWVKEDKRKENGKYLRRTKRKYED